jgi:hypothetical protein
MTYYFFFFFFKKVVITKVLNLYGYVMLAALIYYISDTTTLLN